MDAHDIHDGELVILLTLFRVISWIAGVIRESPSAFL
jgi:hypothetical protein